MFGWIQTSQTGGQTNSDTSPYGECSLDILSFLKLRSPSKEMFFSSGKCRYVSMTSSMQQLNSSSATITFHLKIFLTHRQLVCVTQKRLLPLWTSICRKYFLQYLIGWYILPGGSKIWPHHLSIKVMWGKDDASIS